MKSDIEVSIKANMFNAKGKMIKKIIKGHLHKHTNDIVFTKKGNFMYYEEHRIEEKLHRRSGWYPFDINNKDRYIQKDPIESKAKTKDKPFTEVEKEVIKRYLRTIKFPEIKSYRSLYWFLKDIMDGKSVSIADIKEALKNIRKDII